MKDKRIYFARETVNRLWIGAMLVGAFVCLFALIFAACAKQPESASAGNAANSDFFTRADGGGDSAFPAVNAAGGEDGFALSTGADVGTVPVGTGGEAPVQATPTPVRLGVTGDAGRAYLDQLIFMGDSTTYGIGFYYDKGYYDLVPPSQVWTPASGTLTLAYYDVATILYPETGEEIPIRDAVERAKPAYLVITLGVNGISFMGETEFKNTYTELVRMVQEASPDTKIILNSMYPVAADYPGMESINNTKINAGNQWVEQVAAETGVRFLYSFESVVGADGYLPAEYCNGDGIHLSGEGFQKVMEYVRTHAYE